MPRRLERPWRLVAKIKEKEKRKCPLIWGKSARSTTQSVICDHRLGVTDVQSLD